MRKESEEDIFPEVFEGSKYYLGLHTIDGDVIEFRSERLRPNVCWSKMGTVIKDKETFNLIAVCDNSECKFRKKLC